MMMSESSINNNILVTDIGQTLADGGMQYFRRYRGKYDLAVPATLVPVYNEFVPLPFAQEEFPILVQNFQFGGYYTVRPPELRDQAEEWLTRYNFPDSKNIRISASPREKLEQVIADFPDARSILLVDDNTEKIGDAAIALIDEHPEVKDMLSRLILVGFGNRYQRSKGELNFKTGIKTAILASWEERKIVDLLIDLSTLLVF